MFPEIGALDAWASVTFPPKKSLSAMRAKQPDNPMDFVGSTATHTVRKSCVGLAFREDLFDHADSDGAAHVSDGEPSEFWNIREGLQDHVVQGFHLHEGAVPDFEEARLLLDNLTRTWVNFLDEFLERHTDRRSMRVQHWRVSCGDGCRVVDDNDLSNELFSDRRRLVGVAHDLSPSDLVLCNASNVEADFVSMLSLRLLILQIIKRIYLAELSGGIEDDLVTILHNTRLDTSHRDSSNPSDRVHVLNWNAKRLVQRLRWRNEIVKRIEHCNPLVPRRVGALFR